MKLNKEEIILFVKQNLKTIVAAFICSILFVVIAVYYFNINKNEDYSDINFTQQKTETKTVDNENSEKDDKNIFVDVKGAVKNPGVYETTKEKRIKDIIEEAGGLLEDADTSNINLSQKLKDQMVIYILKKGEKSKQLESNHSMENNKNNDIININTANKEQLMKISGVGKTKAEAIIEYREKNGDFKKKEDITKVKGIGKSTFEKIKEKIEV
ncbi:helix-hairpin-helix domain-containing protein [Gemella cuniculi]|uniref:helix-hairpin-helix domain-containing protein n=1 Tax=Gemella cuniculi TaxID=150240 RepID=UPI0004085E17|nr:helix-hairpin-helix domain-containing protein [Gemella cuniculi]